METVRLQEIASALLIFTFVCRLTIYSFVSFLYTSIVVMTKCTVRDA